ncbi:hypothetical protein [Pedobacter cryoconitis]|uniref:hypothetical protein n=1 Tax=Pedobacter cryoconitis TaxID=188932 RepID=UPI0016221D15|nr:hypothetical protein [Pedobacter cryoconitis]MBB5645156.1 hypothetical protein [Pedobacter cryoconitis]
MSLKHEIDIKRLSCDLNKYVERHNRTAYCWVFEEISNKANFVPRAIAVGRDECGSWALSFYETEEQAKQRMKDLLGNKSQLYKKLGTHIANGQLEKKDGISDDSNLLGHFNHFEYDGVDLKEKFIIIGYSYK